MTFSQAAIEIAEQRYMQGDETKIEHVFSRVADALAQVEKDYGATEEEIQEYKVKFYNLMQNKKFIPAGRTLANAGAGTDLVANCIVLNIDDNMDSIGKTLHEAMLLQQQGSGLGFDFSKLRPVGYKAKRSNGNASGPVSFLEIYDNAFSIIKQQGRHGANMGMLRIDHPDILDFISCKEQEGVITNFNISVLVTDEFMQKLHDNPDEQWLCRFDGVGVNPRKITHTKSMFGREEKIEVVDITVGELWQRLCEGAHRNGEPGLSFIDTVNKNNPLPGLGELSCSNPCVVGDTWVHTDKGPRKVDDLVGINFNAKVNGKIYNSKTGGFWYTDNKNVFELVTKEGYAITLTKDHKVQTINGMVEAGELVSGDKIILNDHQHKYQWKGISPDEYGVEYRNEGAYLLGQLVGDGTFMGGPDIKIATICVWEDSEKDTSVTKYLRENYLFSGIKGGMVFHDNNVEKRLASKKFTDYAASYNIVHGNKTITDEIEYESSEFYIEFLMGLFDADGTVASVESGGKSNYVRLSQSNLELLQKVQRMLLRLGIFSRIYDRSREYIDFSVSKQYELHIGGDHLERFATNIGFRDENKEDKLLTGLTDHKTYKKPFEATFDYLKKIGREDVYDCTVYDIHMFDANGFVVSNCGEQHLHPYDSCNLGSINVSAHYTMDAGIDYESLGRTVELSVRMLDNTIDLFNHGIIDVNLMAKKNRRIGLGIMGFADLCFKSRTRYGSERSINLAEQVMGFINGRAEHFSSELAKEKSNFPNHSLSIFTDARRNAALTSIAPTGSISMILDVNSGIEPWFNLVYTKKVRAGEFSYISPVFESALRDNFEGYDMKEILSHLHKGLSLSEINRDYIEIPEWILDVFVTTSDIKPIEHVDIQATFQKYTNNSISKTINLPNDTTVDDIDKAGKYAWTNGCRSVTFYRDGSREHQVLNTGEIKPEGGVEELEHFHGVIDRPSTVHGETHMIQTAHGKMYVTVNMWEYNGETKPYEIFAHVGKEGQCSYTYVSAITRMISLALRSGVPIDEIVSQYKGISCHTGWHEGRRNEGPIDALSQVLEKFIGKNIAGIINDVGEKIKDDIMPIDIENLPICPSCQVGWLVSEEGCWKCMNCNWSKC